MRYKSLLLLVIGMVALTGCRSSEKVRSTKAYKEAVKNVQIELAEKGYRLQDTKRSSDIDGTKLETYILQDTNGNSMEFSVGYRVKNDEDVYYVEDVHVDGCKTSNGNVYEDMCGYDSPIYKIEKLKKDEKISHVSAGKTIFFLVGLPILITGGLFAIVFGGLAAGA